MFRGAAPRTGVLGDMPAPSEADRAVLLALTPDRIAETLRVRETIGADADATARARALLNRVADTVEQSARFRIDLVLTDMICQRNLDCATESARDFYLEISRAPGRLRVELVDDGQPQAPPSGEPASPGAGLELVAELADRWGMTVDGSTAIWFEFELGAGG